jgi:hypothetical protein
VTRPEQLGSPGASAPTQSLTEASRAARGRHPLQLLARGEVAFAPEISHYAPPLYSPELHILDSEWYFTSASSALLGAMLAQDRPCLIGTPTVALHMPLADFILVDRSPYVLDRFPSLPGTRVRNVDVHGWEAEPGSGAVLIDPPWYFPEFGRWLDIALRAVELGGVVVLPLLGEQTRPTAAQERDRVLEFLKATGRVEVLREAVEYDIPVFEARALSAAGVSLSGPWRRADVAIAHVSRRPQDPLRVPVSRNDDRLGGAVWTTYLIGAQVVKIRFSQTGSLAGDGLLEPVAGVDGFTLDSVSRRDPRIDQIDIWSSRNRVARAVNAALLTRALRIAEASPLKGARLADELLRQGLSRRHIHELFDYLEMTDGD